MSGEHLGGLLCNSWLAVPLRKPSAKLFLTLIMAFGALCLSFRCSIVLRMS